MSPTKTSPARARTTAGPGPRRKGGKKSTEARTAAPPRSKRATTTPTPQAEILRRTHVHRSQAHTSALGRRQQARRDTKSRT